MNTSYTETLEGVMKKAPFTASKIAPKNFETCINHLTNNIIKKKDQQKG